MALVMSSQPPSRSLMLQWLSCLTAGNCPVVVLVSFTPVLYGWQLRLWNRAKVSAAPAVFHGCWYGSWSQLVSDRKVTCWLHLSPTLHLDGKYDCTSSLFLRWSAAETNHEPYWQDFIQQFRPSVALIVHLKASWWPIEASRMLLVIS